MTGFVFVILAPDHSIQKMLSRPTPRPSMVLSEDRTVMMMEFEGEYVYGLPFFAVSIEVGGTLLESSSAVSGLKQICYRP